MPSARPTPRHHHRNLSGGTMKKSMLFVLWALYAAVFTGYANAAENVSFPQLIDHLDERKNTKLHAKEYWSNIKGKEAIWSGEVVDVDGGKSKAKVYIADKSRPTFKGYNIVLVTHDVAKAANLKKGQKIRFKGLLDDYDSKEGGAIIKLKEGDVL